MWLVAVIVAGLVPAALPAPSRIVWITPAGDEAPAGCTLHAGRAWSCDQLPPAPGGVVVIVDVAGTLAYVPVGGHDHESGGVSSWGRVVQVAPGGVAPEAVRNLQVTPFKPERPTYRASTLRFSAVQDVAVRVLRLSAGAFWIAGQTTDSDAYVQIEGPAIATRRVAVRMLADGPPEWPLVEAMNAPGTMTGQVSTDRGDDVEGAVVDLLEPLHRQPTDDPPYAPLPLIKVATTTAAADGTFVFDRLDPGRYHVAVIHARLGRGDADVSALSTPVSIRLMPPVVVRGRVLRNGLPVPAARVRFIPDVLALMAGTDPANHIADETTTTPEGGFSLRLPPDPTGALQVIGHDNASVRVPIKKTAKGKELSLGDITLPERRRIGIRLAKGDGCALAAVGPVGVLGLSIVQVTVESVTTWVDLPEAGEWALTAMCGGTNYDVSPRTLLVPRTGPDIVVDAMLAR